MNTDINNWKEFILLKFKDKATIPINEETFINNPAITINTKYFSFHFLLCPDFTSCLDTSLSANNYPCSIDELTYSLDFNENNMKYLDKELDYIFNFGWKEIHYSFISNTPYKREIYLQEQKSTTYYESIIIGLIDLLTIGLFSKIIATKKIIEVKPK